MPAGRKSFIIRLGIACNSDSIHVAHFSWTWFKRLSIGGGVKGFTAAVDLEHPKKLTFQNVIKNVRTPLMLQPDEA